jgi:hypothetical protein
MTEDKRIEVIEKGNELAGKFMEVLQKEFGEGVPTSILLYAAAKFYFAW